METQARFFDERDAEALFAAACDLRAYLKREGINETDIRVNATDGGSWSLLSGDSSYDTDHRGYWGASCLSVDDDDERIVNTLAEMIDQACDHASDNGVCGSEGIGMPEREEIERIMRHVAK